MKLKTESEVAQSCLTLSDPMDCSLPGSRVHGICQARVLEWGAIAFSYGRVNAEQTRSRHRAHREGGGGGQLPSGSPRHPLGSGSGRLRRCICCGWGARRGGEARQLFYFRAGLTPGFPAGTNTLHRLHLSGCLRLGTRAAALRKASGCSRNGSTSYYPASFKSPWRNRLARSAVNRKAGGLSPPGDDYLYNAFGYSLRVRSYFWLLIHPFCVNME